jgi:hypothetical protein
MAAWGGLEGISSILAMGSTRFQGPEEGLISAKNIVLDTQVQDDSVFDIAITTATISGRDHAPSSTP